MENWVDACENRWLRRIMRIAYKDSITHHKRNDETTSTNVQSEQTDAIKMVRACVMDESQHTDQKCTSNREKMKRTTEEKMDRLYWREPGTYDDLV